ncbi:MAG: GAF domain-containing protein [Gemmatimonadetes bacterium]|nr:GAF domain-containing protein [Gemmatimonadota bacterium]
MRTPLGPPGVDVPGQREMLAVREIVHAFLHADRPAEAFQFALDRVGPVVGASFASVYLLEGASELMSLAAAYNWPERLRPWLADVRVRVGFGPSGEAASERRVIEVPDVFADPDLEDWQEVARELEFRALVALPLQSGTAALGAVTFYFRNWDDFTVERRGLLRLVADLMSAAAERSRLLDRMRRADAAAVEALTELDRQYIAVAHARRVGRDFIAAASDAIRPALGALADGSPAADAARRLVDDLALIAEIEGGGVTASAEPFDPRSPLRAAMRAAMRAVAPPDGSVHLIAEEPTHTLPVVRGDADKVGIVVARLLTRALLVAESGEVRASVAVVSERVEYRLPGSAGEDVEWRLAAALATMLGAELVEDAKGGVATVVFSLPIGAQERGTEPIRHGETE